MPGMAPEQARQVGRRRHARGAGSSRHIGAGHKMLRGDINPETGDMVANPFVQMAPEQSGQMPARYTESRSQGIEIVPFGRSSREMRRHRLHQGRAMVPRQGRQALLGEFREDQLIGQTRPLTASPEIVTVAEQRQQPRWQGTRSPSGRAWKPIGEPAAGGIEDKVAMSRITSPGPVAHAGRDDQCFPRPQKMLGAAPAIQGKAERAGARDHEHRAIMDVPVGGVVAALGKGRGPVGLSKREDHGHPNPKNGQATLQGS